MNEIHHDNMDLEMSQNSFLPKSSTDYAVLFTLAAALVVFICYLFAVPISYVTYFVSDDAYYYFMVARNLVAGVGLSFDDYNMSNGFHPLWMLVLLPIYSAAQGDPELALRLIISLQGVIAFFSFWLCWLYTTKITSPAMGVTALLMLMLFASPLIILFNGLESGLLIFWTFFLLTLDQKFRLLDNSASLPKRFLLGTVLAVFALIRLDTVFFVIAMAIIKLIWFPADKSFLHKAKNLVILYLPSAVTYLLILSPYFIWNLTTFGHLTPISGALKSTFPDPIFEYHFSSHALPYVPPFLVTVAWALYSSLSPNGYLRNSLYPKWRSNSSFLMLGIIWLGCAIHLSWTQLFMAWGVYQWHFVTYIPLLVILITLVLHSIARRSGNPSWVAYGVPGAAFLALAIYSILVSIDKGTHHKVRLTAAEWVKDNVSTDTSLALSDAGVFAYFNQRHTINLDGLINSYDFQEAIINDTLPAFLERQKVHYIAAVNTNCAYKKHLFLIRAYQGKNRKHPIGYRVTAKKSAEIYSSEPFAYRPLTVDKKFCFVIWKMSDVRMARITNR